jgi:hypothetical protein
VKKKSLSFNEVANKPVEGRYIRACDARELEREAKLPKLSNKQNMSNQNWKIEKTVENS